MQNLKLRLLVLLFTISIVANCWSEDYISGQILVQLKKNISASNLQSELKNTEFISSKLLSKRMNIWLLKYNPNKYTDQEIYTKIKLSKKVKELQFNHTVEERSTYPDDERFNQQWCHENIGQSGGIEDADMDSPEAWDINVGGITSLGDTVVVAIVDGGCYMYHEDLNYWKNKDEIPLNGIDDDNNGYVDDYDGWNAYSSSGNVPSNSHGTHVAGIAAAIGNNGIGVTGVNWNAKIMPVRGSSNSESIVIEAYGYVLEMRSIYNETNGEQGALVVATNASFGVNYGNPENYPLWSAIYDSLGQQGVLSAAATMNENANVDVLGDMPTACDSDYLITVTNTTHNDVRNSGAAYGATTIDLGAPGTSIRSTDQNNTYSNKTGTSMATPQVTGAIALMFSAAPQSFLDYYNENPAEGALQIKQYLLNSVDPIESLADITVSGGRLNLFNALQMFDYDTGFEGVISSDTTWTGNISISGDVVVDSLATLLIEPGTTINLLGNYSFIIKGNIISNGTTEATILFTRQDTLGFSDSLSYDGGWKGISFQSNIQDNINSEISYTEISHVKTINPNNEFSGAISLINAEGVLISNCSFNNNLSLNGAGLNINNIQNCEISNNNFKRNKSYQSGGAIFINQMSSLQISNSQFTNNISNNGGAIYCSGSNSKFTNNMFFDNKAINGGGLYISADSTLIKNCIIEQNFAENHGGGIHVEYSAMNPISIINNEIFGNSSMTGGGISASVNSHGRIINNTIFSNTANLGGGIEFDESSYEVYNNTIVSNEASESGGSISLNSASIIMQNNIIWTNLSGDNTEIWANESNLEIFYNDIHNINESIYLSESSNSVLENNLSENPIFSFDEVSPYSLDANSPCIDAGNPDSDTLNLPQFDLNNNPRFFRDRIDMGAYENQYVPNTENENIIKHNGILQCYPNPFVLSNLNRSQNANIRFFISKEGIVKINLFNVKGQKVKTLINSHFSSGIHDFSWKLEDKNNRKIPSGLYFYKLETSDIESIKRILIIK